MPQLRCEDVMTRRPRTCAPSDTLLDGLKLMKEIDVGFVPVCERPDRRLVGVLTDRDVALALTKDARPSQLHIRDVMTHDPLTCGPDEELLACTRLMEERQVSRVPIVDNNRSLVGVIAMADVARKATSRHEYEQPLAKAEEGIAHASH